MSAAKSITRIVAGYIPRGKYFSISTDIVGCRNYLPSICVQFIECAVALSKINLPLQRNKDGHVT